MARWRYADRVCQYPACNMFAVNIFDLPFSVRPHPNGDSLPAGSTDKIAVSLCGRHSRYYRAMSLVEREKQVWQKPRRKVNG